MDRILLTGSSGFLGQHLLSQLEIGSALTLSRSSGDIKCDLTREVPEIAGVKTVIHCAGVAHQMKRSDKTSVALFRANVSATENLLNGLAKDSVLKEFVFISSVSVYGLSEGLLVKEEAPLMANDAYGRSKIECEKIVAGWCLANNIRCTILRLPLVVGSNAPGNLRSMVNGIKAGYYFNVGRGQARKSMVLASDVGKYILRAASVGGFFNLTDSYHPTFQELSTHIAAEAGVAHVRSMPSWLVKFLGYAGDILPPGFPVNSDKVKKIISSLTFDDSKAKAAFGWSPTPVLRGFKL